MFWIILDSIYDNSRYWPNTIVLYNHLCPRVLIKRLSFFDHKPTDSTSLNFLKELQFSNKYFEFEGTYTAVIILFTFSSIERTTKYFEFKEFN